MTDSNPEFMSDTPSPETSSPDTASPASGFPESLDQAIAQATTATRAALEAGIPRMQVDIAIPELKAMPIAQQFYPLLQDMGKRFRVYFPDAGAAALAKRDWGNPDFLIRGLGETQTSVDPDDDVVLVVEPSAVEVHALEDLCNAVVDCQVILLNPKLEDVATIGIGYAGRQLRDRFISTLQTIYYLRPLDGASLLRVYPDPWQVWREVPALPPLQDYELMAEFPNRPTGEELDTLLFAPAGDGDGDGDGDPAPTKPPRRGLLSELQQFLRALSQ
jgi:hypothetical protein